MSVLRIPTAKVFEPLLRPARYKGAYGGRGSAKSHFFAGLAVEESIAERTDIVCLREVQKSLKFSCKKLIENKIIDMNAGDYFTVKDEEIRSRNGGVMIFQGMQNHTADSIKSLEGFDRAWFEEAQSASQTSLDLLRPTLRKDGSELWFSWNPRFQTDPIDQLLRGAEPPPRSVVINCSYEDNPWFPLELQEEMEYDRRRDPDKYGHIWLGGYQKSSRARVFHNWRVEEFDTARDAVFRLGADWGFSVDPTVMVRCYVVGRTLYVDHEAYAVGCEIVNIPDLFMSIPQSERWPCIADSSRPETISHVKNNGFPHIRAAVKGAKSLEEGVEFLKAYDIVVHPRCRHTIDELSLYSYKVDEQTQEILPVLADRDNHVIDALRYALESVRRTEANKRPAIPSTRVARYTADAEMNI